MLKKFIHLLSLFLCSTLLGCVLVPARPQLTPHITFHDSGVTNSQHDTLVINTADSRESFLVGTRGQEGMSAPVIVSDLTLELQQNFTAMAEHHGYQVAAAPNKNSKRTLKARLLVLSETLVPTTFSANFKNDIAIEVTASNNNKQFVHIYHLTKEKNAGFGDTAAGLQRRFTQNLEELFLQIAYDNNLWSFLDERNSSG